MVWSFTIHIGALWSTVFLGRHSFIAGISKAEKSKEFFLSQGKLQYSNICFQIKTNSQNAELFAEWQLRKKWNPGTYNFCFWSLYLCLFWYRCPVFLGFNDEKQCTYSRAQTWPSHIPKSRSLEMLLSVSCRTWHPLTRNCVFYKG